MPCSTSWWPTGCGPGFGLPSPNRRPTGRLRAKVWQDPRTVIGGSDAGAHLDMMCGAVYSTCMLGNGVRQRELLSWEEAIRLLTDVPARLYGLAPGAGGRGMVGRPRGVRPGHGGPRARAQARRHARRGQPPLCRGHGHRARPGQRVRDREARQLHWNTGRPAPEVGPRHRDGGGRCSMAAVMTWRELRAGGDRRSGP